MFADLPEAQVVEPLALLLAALLVDAAVGYFNWLFRVAPHPPSVSDCTSRASTAGTDSAMARPATSAAAMLTARADASASE